MREQEKHFAVVNGIAIGEESKGNTVQAVVRELDAHTVWRSGGWQGGHHILHDDGREMALNHFGAGVFEGADTYLKHMVINPVQLFQEALQLEDLGIDKPFDRIVIDEDCVATTPFHSGISRTREILRGPNKKGTIGVGVGEAVRDSVDPELTIRAGEFRDRATVLRKADTIRRAKLEIAEQLLAAYQGTPPEEVYAEIDVLRDNTLVGLVADAFEATASLVTISDEAYVKQLLDRSGAIVNEVSHGALHHPRYGFVPHITQIDPTSRDVIKTVKDQNYDGNLIRLGIVRSYLTRHGAGPLVSFNRALTDTLVPIEKHNNGANEWLGEFRTGHFDIVALGYALAFSGKEQSYDGLFLSYMDMLKDRTEWDVVESYEYTGVASDIDEYFEQENNTIVRIKVYPDTDPDLLDAHQRRLTHLLGECEPIVTTLQATAEKNMEQTFIDFVTDRLEVPVIGTAYGPKVTDRYFLSEWQNVRSKNH